MYDLIGDIHGHATPLKALLRKLGYQQGENGWSHPERKVIFLGDFIDRGPEQVEVYNIARAMVETGNALTVMGNHEFNAVAYATETYPSSGEYLRPHIHKNRHQHKAFLEQVGEGSTLHKEIIDWFKTLPLYLDLPALRVVHACWSPKAIELIAPLIDNKNVLLPESWLKVCKKGSREFKAAETLLKGLEVSLPDGGVFQDKDGVSRSEIRTKWWQEESHSYAEIAMVADDEIDQIPGTPIDTDVLPGYDGIKPVFLGHYWLNGDPAPLTNHIACLDYSIAAVKSDDRKLVAYQWMGESKLKKDHFSWVTLGG